LDLWPFHCTEAERAAAETTINSFSKYQMRKISWFLCLSIILLPIAQVAAGQRINNFDHVKKSVARLGVGSKAKATVTLNDGSKVKGYIYISADDDFVIRDRKTDALTTIRYADVKSVADNRGHHNAKLVLILVGIGAAVTVAAVFGSILANER